MFNFIVTCAVIFFLKIAITENAVTWRMVLGSIYDVFS